MLATLARLGYVSKSLIYAVIGYLALMAALRRGGKVTDTSGALRELLDERFGQLLLLVLGIGLCGYAAWRILDAIRDPDQHGTDAKGLITRIGNVVRAVVYGALGIESLRLFGGLGGSNPRAAQMWTSRLMDWPFGEVLVGIGGAIVAVYGVSEVVAAFRGGYSKTLDVRAIPAGFRKTAETISRLGIGARGVIITILGVFLVRAALQQDPSEAQGTRGSILTLTDILPGRLALTFIGLGLLAYAFDQLLHARYRKIARVL